MMWPHREPSRLDKAAAEVADNDARDRGERPPGMTDRLIEEARRYDEQEGRA